MRQVPADRPAIADRPVGDEADRLRHEGAQPGDHIGRLDGRLAGQRPDRQRAILLAYVGDVGQPVDVDQHCRPDQAQVHQGDQALAAGQDFSVVAVSRQPRQRIINTRRTDVLKRCGFHTLIAPFAQPPGTRLTGQLQGPCVAFARRAGTATATTCLLLSRSFGVAS